MGIKNDELEKEIHSKGKILGDITEKQMQERLVSASR